MSETAKILVAMQNDLRYADALKAAGWEVLTAADAHRAYSVARHSSPAVIVLDHRLGRGGPLAALDSLRSSIHTASIPVIALVPNGPKVKELTDAGASRCLSPVADAKEVIEAVKAYVALPVNGKAAEAAGPSTVTLTDADRIGALKKTGLLDTPPDEEYDRLTRLAARLTAAPMAALSLIDKDRQFLKSQVSAGHQVTQEVPLSHSFCKWVVGGNEAVVVEDARTHPVLQHNPAVRQMGVIAYAGIPVRSIGGKPLGSFCAVDVRPRQWSSAHIETLTDLARLAEVLVARNMLGQGERPKLADVKWYSKAASEAILGASRILRREELTATDRAILLDEIEQNTRTMGTIRAAARASPLS